LPADVVSRCRDGIPILTPGKGSPTFLAVVLPCKIPLAEKTFRVTAIKKPAALRKP
jgi:hypothetical protein